ncbi:MAG: hypothetical protein VX265_15600 [Myxococcota bacterium]|nr:hypothetical protein [Myxococcota bacterium]
MIHRRDQGSDVTSLQERLQAFLSSPLLPGLAALLAVILGLPSLRAGWFGDDFVHRAILHEGVPGLGFSPVWDLFRFMDGGPYDEMKRELGLLPWWSAPDLAIGFFRPLSAITHMLDDAWWPDSAPLQHAHSLLWTGLAVLGVGTLLRQALPDHPAAAGLGALLFACEDAHALPIAWIANRNALVALALGAAAVAVHIAWRRRGGLHRAAGALGLLALALASGESAVSAAGFILAFQLTAETGDWRRRLGAAIPAVVLVIGWRILYDLLGYGARGSGLYIDPGEDPLAFFSAVVERAPVLALAQWTSAPVDALSALGPEATLGASLAGIIATAAMAALLWPVLRANAGARFLGLATVGALVAPSATFPMDRLLTFSSAGAAGLVGLLLVSRVNDWRRRPALGLFLLHGPVSALFLGVRVMAAPMMGDFFAEGEAFAPIDDTVEDQSLIFLNGTVMAPMYTFIIREAERHRPVPRRMHVLTSQLQGNELLREDENTLVIAPEGGFLTIPISWLLRATDRPFQVGQRIDRVDFTAEVRATTPDGRPRVVAFHFQTPLEDPGLRFMVATGEGFGTWTPPPVGARHHLPFALPRGASEMRALLPGSLGSR